jgi:arylsulfatase A
MLKRFKESYNLSAIDDERLTIGSLVKRAGYTTFLIGTWQLGLRWRTKQGFISLDSLEYYTLKEQDIDFYYDVDSGPNNLGFDYTFYSAGSPTAEPPYCYIENGAVVKQPDRMLSQITDTLSGLDGLASADYNLAQIDTIFTHRAIRKIEKHLEENDDQPFLLYFAPGSVHAPYHVPDFARGKSNAGPRGDSVWLVDWITGQIIDCLKENGIYDETVIIFTSDNGPVVPDEPAHPQMNSHRSAGKLRGYKGDIFEGSHRVPLIIVSEGKIAAGSVSNEVVCLTDLMATIAGITDQRMTYFDAADSYDLSDILHNRKYDKPFREATIHQNTSGLLALRRGRWKVIFGENDNIKGVYPLPIPRGMVYDMANDPFEKNDLWDQKTKLVRDFTIILDQYLVSDRTAPIMTGLARPKDFIPIDY